MGLYTRILLVLIAFSSSTYAQSPTQPASNGPVQPTGKVHPVDVGKDNFNYQPQVTFADVGDVVQFNFYPTNHSVTRAEYGFPCIPYELTGPGKVGFYSGHFLTQELTDPPSWNLTINDTLPVFYYCTAIDSCDKFGMVGVINPNSSVSIAQQQSKAEQAPYMLEPGQAFPAEGSPSPALTPSAAPSSSEISKGAIAGIVIAAVVFISFLAGFFWLLGRHRAARGKGQDNSSRVPEWASSPGNHNSVGPWSGSEPYHRSTWDEHRNQAMFPQSPNWHEMNMSPPHSAGLPQENRPTSPPGPIAGYGSLNKIPGADTAHTVHEAPDSSAQLMELEASSPPQSPPLYSAK